MTSDIVGVMDMDGFLIGKKFYCKELGLLKVGDVAAPSYFFDLGIQWSNFTKYVSIIYLVPKKTTGEFRLIHHYLFSEGLR